MGEALTIVAKITARPGDEAEVEDELRKLIAPTRAETGCITYDLHRSTEDPRVFLFYENWTSKPQWERHMKTPHLKAFARATKDLVEDLELLQMVRIG